MPLHHAVASGNLVPRMAPGSPSTMPEDMVKELLKHGADIEAPNHDGLSALELFGAI